MFIGGELTLRAGNQSSRRSLRRHFQLYTTSLYTLHNDYRYVSPTVVYELPADSD